MACASNNNWKGGGDNKHTTIARISRCFANVESTPRTMSIQHVRVIDAIHHNRVYDSNYYYYSFIVALVFAQISTDCAMTLPTARKHLHGYYCISCATIWQTFIALLLPGCCCSCSCSTVLRCMHSSCQLLNLTQRRRVGEFPLAENSPNTPNPPRFTRH